MSSERQPFHEWIQLEQPRLGTRVTYASDEFFAAKERLIQPETPVFIPDKYDEHGKWMDGWESRRKRGPGHDYCIVRLGVPGVLRGVEIDTSHFTGNYPPQASLDACRPGATLPEIHDASVKKIVEGLLELRLLEGDAAELVAREAFKPFYMHSTSHWLGLDVHDVGAYKVDGEPRPLEPGMVFTVEPGLYLAPDQEVADARFRGIGVRIEDDVAITTSGYENLSAAIPKDPDEVEALVASR